MSVTQPKSAVADLDCPACRNLLPDYVRLEYANQVAELAYPLVALHLEQCPHCSAIYYQEFRTQGLTQSVAQLQQIGLRGVKVTAALQQILTPPPPIAVLWQTVQGTLHRLRVELPILISHAHAVFDQLAAPLTPQLAPVAALRSKAAPIAAQESVTDDVPFEWVRLYPPNVDLEITLSVVAVSSYQSTLAVWVKTRPEEQVAVQARVTLRTGEGDLLEMNATDGEGLVLFRALELGRYLVQITHAGQTWEVAVPLTEFPARGQV